MKKNIFEIYLTSAYVTGDNWLKFLLKMSQINGKVGKWNLWIHIENNCIHYYIETKRMLPPVLGELGDFLLKKVEFNLPKRPKHGMVFCSFYTENMLDAYDKLDTRSGQKVQDIKIKFYTYKYGNYFNKIFFYIKDQKGNLIKRKSIFNGNIHDFISIDFGTHIRFFYQKNESKYLDTKKVINVLTSDKNNAILQADAFPYVQDKLYLSYKNYDFAKHSIVIGASGTGKSKLISSLISNLSKNSDNRMKYKIVIIDPHAAMERDIGGLPNTDVVDFRTEQTSINLFSNSTDDIIATTEAIMSIFKNIISDRYNSKLERVLRYSINILLSRGEFNLFNLRKLLIEIEYRNSVIRAVEQYVQPNIIEFFRVDFNELRTKSYQEAISPIIAIIDEIQLLPAMNQPNIVKDLKSKIQENFITILSLDQMTLGLNITKMLAGFAMQQILQFVQSNSFNEHIILVVDEVAVVENPILSRFLSESRKYNLSLILAAQFFEQISEKLQKSIFTNVINYFVFRVSRIDAITLEKNLQMEVAVRNSIIVRLKMLSEQNDRECIVRIGKNGRMLSSFRARTLDFIPCPRKNIPARNIVTTNPKANGKQTTFNTNTSSNLKKLMQMNSSSRRKVTT